MSLHSQRDPHRTIREDFATSDCEHVCVMVRRYGFDGLLVSQRAQDVHYQRSSEDQLSWWVFAGCADAGGHSSLAVTQRYIEGEDEAARAKVVELV